MYVHVLSFQAASRHSVLLSELASRESGDLPGGNTGRARSGKEKRSAARGKDRRSGGSQKQPESVSSVLQFMSTDEVSLGFRSLRYVHHLLIVF